MAGPLRLVLTLAAAHENAETKRPVRLYKCSRHLAHRPTAITFLSHAPVSDYELRIASGTVSRRPRFPRSPDRRGREASWSAPVLRRFARAATSLPTHAPVSFAAPDQSGAAAPHSKTLPRLRPLSDPLAHSLTRSLPRPPCSAHAFGFSCGNRMTSRMLSWPSSIMHRRSMPMPMPPAGGMPCSRATIKSSSSFCCSPPA